ncbi:MAG: DUF6878 family protein [Methylocella sp.]|jgi:uncharacterized protein DUF6878
MTSSTTTPDGQHEPPLPPDYDAQSALYNRLEDETTTRNKATVFDALAKAGIVIVTISFDGCSDSGQIEDVQANTQDELVALPSDPIEYERIRWGETEPTRSSCSLHEALEDLAFHYLGTTHGGWEDNDGAYGEFTFDTATRSITLAYNERFTDSIYSEHEF